METMNNAALIFAFLRDVSANNNRPWFAEHKEYYLEAKAEFEQMAQAFINRLGTFDSSVAHLTVSECVYRFYRDTRFSEDKSPYKNHMGCYVSAHGKKSYHGGYYLHMEPDNCMIAGGAYCLTPQMLKAVRQSIAYEFDEYCAIVDAKDFHHYFPLIGMERVKTAPKGFPKDAPYIDYIRPKDYSCCCAVPESFYLSPDWLDKTEVMCRLMKPYLDFINYTIDDYE
jgi:uncharacterized protein (TIGR02453 family)